MKRRLIRFVLAAVIGLVAGFAAVKFFYGPINGPSAAPASDALDILLRERIKVPEGYRFTVFARDLGTPRMMQMTAGGDLIVSGYGNGNILLVKSDQNGDGRSDGVVVLKENMALPHGLLLEGNTLYVAEEQRVLKFDFDGAALKNQTVVLEGLPEGGGHSSRTIGRGPDGYLYVTAGSSCNSCIEEHPWRAAMIRFKEGEKPEHYAKGLRNTVGFAWQPEAGALYGVDNGRDNLGDDVPDDEVNRIEQGHHYGWPFMHGKDVPDPQLAEKAPAGVTLTPQAYGLGAHVAPLSILFLDRNTALVAEHGSWNRSTKAGYRIVKLTFGAEGISEEVFLSGCVKGEEVICRPVGLLEGPDGSLYVSDDFVGAIYRITAPD